MLGKVKQFQENRAAAKIQKTWKSNREKQMQKEKEQKELQLQKEREKKELQLQIEREERAQNVGYSILRCVCGWHAAAYLALGMRQFESLTMACLTF